MAKKVYVTNAQATAARMLVERARSNGKHADPAVEKIAKATALADQATETIGVNPAEGYVLLAADTKTAEIDGDDIKVGYFARAPDGTGGDGEGEFHWAGIGESDTRA
jgi:hypothetical protein